MAEKNRPMPGPGHGRGGPKPKLKNPKKTLGRVMGYVARKYAVHLVLVAIFIVVSVLASVQGTLFMKTLIDSYILPVLKDVQAGAPADFSGLLRAISQVALFYLCGVAAGFIQTRLMIYVTQGTLQDLRNELFQHMQRLPIRYLTPIPTGISCPSTPMTPTPSAR